MSQLFSKLSGGRGLVLCSIANVEARRDDDEDRPRLGKVVELPFWDDYRLGRATQGMGETLLVEFCLGKSEEDKTTMKRMIYAVKGREHQGVG
ncbi:hypothetical protein N7486_007921 [Penicillium sp. IBT 16267x]|nr:hypothetical protein N7486_007921 [Penicillium sp. IBT 16267x]